MNRMQQVKQELRKPNFRQSSLKKLFLLVFKWLQVEDKLAVKLTDKLYDLVVLNLDAQRYSNDEIVTMFDTNEINHRNPLIYKDMSSMIINIDNLSPLKFDIKVGYIPNRLSLSYDDMTDLISLVGKRIQSIEEYVDSLKQILTKILSTNDIAIHINGNVDVYSSHGAFSTSADLWNTFLQAK